MDGDPRQAPIVVGSGLVINDATASPRTANGSSRRNGSIPIITMVLVTMKAMTIESRYVFALTVHLSSTCCVKQLSMGMLSSVNGRVSLQLGR